MFVLKGLCRSLGILAYAGKTTTFRYTSVKYSDLIKYIKYYLLQRKQKKKPYEPFNLYVMNNISSFYNSEDPSLTLDHAHDFWLVYPD